MLRATSVVCVVSLQASLWVRHRQAAGLGAPASAQRQSSALGSPGYESRPCSQRSPLVELVEDRGDPSPLLRLTLQNVAERFGQQAVQGIPDEALDGALA